MTNQEMISGPKGPPKLQIAWPQSHHPGDGAAMIEQVLESGGDDGPLLVLSLEARRRPRDPKLVPTVFKTVYDYLAHISFYDGDVGGERCVAIVQHGADKDAALAFLMQLQQIAAPGTDGIPRKRLVRRKTEAQEQFVTPAHPSAKVEVDVESFGDGLEDALAAYPNLKPFVAGSQEEDQ